jgi:hypothetical protein
MTTRNMMMFVAWALVLTSPLEAQVRTINTGPPGAAPISMCSDDSLIAAALAQFNAPTTVRVFSGIVRIPAPDSSRGSYGVYQGSLRIDGSVRGDVVVLNGDLRVTATGYVAGNVTVLGGRLTIDPGGRVGGTRRACDAVIAVMARGDGTVALRPPTRSLGARASAIGIDVGEVRVTPHLAIGQYNRVEGLPVQVGANAMWQALPGDTLRSQAYTVIRSATDPNHSRGAVGWHVQSELSHSGSLPYAAGIEGGSTIVATEDRPFSSVESGLSAFFLRRDYHDWYLRRGGSVFAQVNPLAEVTVSGSYEISQQSTVQAVNAFSVLRTEQTWRANPLIDDGRYRIASLRFAYDGRDDRAHPVLQWYTRVEVRHVASNDLQPVSLPTDIRDALPSTGYGETEGDLDVRAYLRLDPEQRINARISGGGYLGGDPMTIQRRRAIGGADPLSGYDFRAINCDRRRKPDPGRPALCDRELAVQLEYHHTLPVDLTTRVGPYTVGIRKPDLVLLADAGSAWLAGDSAGRVPTDRIEAIKEWRSDVGAGVTLSWVGFYLAKSLVDPVGLQAVLLFNARF